MGDFNTLKRLVSTLDLIPVAWTSQDGIDIAILKKCEFHRLMNPSSIRRFRDLHRRATGRGLEIYAGDPVDIARQMLRLYKVGCFRICAFSYNIRLVKIAEKDSHEIEERLASLLGTIGISLTIMGSIKRYCESQ